MRHFSYPSILTDISDKSRSGYDIFNKYYEDDCNWLMENGISFQVDVFHWTTIFYSTAKRESREEKERKRLIMNVCVSSVDDDIVQLRRETEQQSIPSGRIDN